MSATLKSLLALGFLSGGTLPGVAAADAAAVATASAPQGLPLEFRGYFSQGSAYVFVVADSAGADIRWLHLGESWHGSTIRSFDARLEQLIVRREGTDLVLPLRGMARAVPDRAVQIVLGAASPVLEDGKLLYSPDTVLQIGESRITAYRGHIKSDLAQTVFEGDFRMDRGSGWVSVADGGKLDAVKGVLTIQSGRMQFTKVDPMPSPASLPPREPLPAAPASPTPTP